MTDKNVNDRVDIKSFLYLRICKEHHDRYEESCKKFIEFQKHMDERRENGIVSIGLESVLIPDDIEAMEQSHAIVIVFAAMCLEAFIYDYAAQNFSGHFVRVYLDKLDLKSKWVIIPQLVTGKKFDTEGEAFQLLGKLVGYRNEIVHAKSKSWPSYDGLKKPIKGKACGEDKLTMVKNSCKAIKELLRELDKLDDRMPKPWWWEVMRSGIDGGNERRKS